MVTKNMPKTEQLVYVVDNRTNYATLAEMAPLLKMETKTLKDVFNHIRRKLKVPTIDLLTPKELSKHKNYGLMQVIKDECLKAQEAHAARCMAKEREKQAARVIYKKGE